MLQPYHPPPTTSREEFFKDGTDQLFREAIYTWILSVERLLKCRKAFARLAGLTSSQFVVLMGAATLQKTNGVTIKEIAEHVALASTHVTTEIGRLQGKGLLAKRKHHTDRRSVLVSLTRNGEKLIERVSPAVRETNDILFRDVTLKGLISAHVVAIRLVANSSDALSLLRKATVSTAKKARS